MWDIVVLGLSITSSWGNGHATTYRSLLRELTRRGHRVTFLERDVPWYRGTRDLPDPQYAKTLLYQSMEELYETHADRVRQADLVIVGSYVPDGIDVARWVLAQARGRVAFYDIDTPVTLAALERGSPTYLARELIPQFDLYLSFTGGAILRRLESEYGARRARALYCSVDPEAYFPEPTEPIWDLGYLGTYASDRQPALQRLLLEPAGEWPEGRFIVAGPCYPDDIGWPANVQYCDHLAPAAHRSFYCQQRFTLNVTRAAMTASGYAPSVRLFEAAACATPIISDWWPGLDELLRPGREVLIAGSASQTLAYLRGTPEAQRRRLGEQARQRILAAHTAGHRAEELERYVRECSDPPLAAIR